MRSMETTESVILTVSVDTTLLPDGSFLPAVSVIFQKDRKWTSMLFQLTERRKFPLKEEALEFGRRTAARELKRRHPEARIDIK